MGRKPSSEKQELLRMLQHARGCDGIRCSACRKIDQRLADGPHIMEDPVARLDVVDQGLRGLKSQNERLYLMLEGAPLPASFRRALHEQGEALERLRQTLRLPLTLSDGVSRKEDPEAARPARAPVRAAPAHPRPVPRRRRARAVEVQADRPSVETAAPPQPAPPEPTGRPVFHRPPRTPVRRSAPEQLLLDVALPAPVLPLIASPSGKPIFNRPPRTPVRASALVMHPEV